MEIKQENIIECDYCPYVVKNDGITKLSEFIDKPCPNCGHNLLTQKDYNKFKRLMRVLTFLNKIVSGSVKSKNPEKTTIKVHDGVTVNIDNQEEVPVTEKENKEAKKKSGITAFFLGYSLLVVVVFALAQNYGTIVNEQASEVHKEIKIETLRLINDSDSLLSAHNLKVIGYVNKDSVLLQDSLRLGVFELGAVIKNQSHLS